MSRLFRGVITFLLALPSVVLCAQPKCTQSLYDPHLSDSAFSTWSDDTSYTVTKTTEPTSHFDTYYITGDIIRITEGQFPSLARDANTPNVRVRSMTFDARLIIIDMPLVFDSTSLVFIAETVRLTGRGAVVLNASTPQPDGDGVSIVTGELDLSNAKTHPFQFVTDNWDYLLDATQTPWPPDRRRTLAISAKRVTTTDPTFQEHQFAFFRDLTLDQKYGYAPGGLSMTPYTIHVADEISAQTYDRYFSTVALWPDELASKVARQFARAPFDDENTKFLSDAYIRPYSPMFRAHHGSAAMKLASVATAIRQGTDSFGQGRYYVPRLSADTVTNAFATDLAATLKVVAGWDTEIVNGFVGGPIDSSKVSAVRNRIDKDKADLLAVQEALGKSISTLTLQEQGIDGQLSLIRVREDGLRAKLAELIAKDATNRDLLTAVHVVAAVASLIPATAPVGIAMSTAVLVTGDLVYKHNAGGTVTAQSVASVVQTGVVFGQKVRAFRDSWDRLHTAVEKTQDPTVQGNDKRAEVNGALNDAIHDFGDKGKSVYDLLQVPEPTTLALNDLEKDDSELQMALVQLASMRSDEGKTLVAIADLKDKVALSASVVVAAQQEFYELLTSDVRNDNYIARERTLALRIRDRLFEHLALDAATLRRAYAYHTGRQLDAPPDLVFFADDYLAAARGVIASQDVATTLADQRTRVENAYDALIILAKNGMLDYLGNRTHPDYNVRVFAADSTNVNDKEQVEFLRILNKSLSESAALKGNGELANPDSIALYLPFEGCEQDTKLPTRLLHIQVTDVKFQDKAAMIGKTIEFRIDHPGYGFVRDDNGCHFVDHRKADAIINSAPYRTVLGVDGPKDIKDVRALYPGTLADLDKFAKYPFCSNYFAYVALKGSPRAANWKTVPKILRIEVSFYSVQ